MITLDEALQIIHALEAEIEMLKTQINPAKQYLPSYPDQLDNWCKCDE